MVVLPAPEAPVRRDEPSRGNGQKNVSQNWFIAIREADIAESYGMIQCRRFRVLK